MVRPTDSHRKNPPSDTSVSDIEDRLADNAVENSDPGRSEDSVKEPRFCTPCRCIVMTIILAAAVTVSTSLIVTDSPNPLHYFNMPEPPGVKAATRWDATSGLYLQVDNACDDTWSGIVEQSIVAWNASEAVVLTLETVEYDMDCAPVNGRLKVCNGDYGETSWKGLNIMAVDEYTEMAIHSISKLNDRYIGTDDERLYIACHENGHGLGLPHTDEDHYNRDRGDCLDYTSNPGRNNVPGDYNLNLLKELYGTPTDPLEVVPVTNSDGNGFDQTDGQTGPTDDEYSSQQNQQGNGGAKEKVWHQRRRMVQQERRWLEEIHQFEIQASMDCMEEHCVFDYTDGYRIEVSQYFAPTMKAKLMGIS